MGGDPAAIRAIAVDADDVVMALETNCRGDERTVLRVTPPFSGRMRARLHVAGDGDQGDDGEPSPILVPPERLVEDRPPYPHPDDTEDALRADPGVEYTPERHHDRHVAAVSEWRDAVRAAIAETVTLPHGDQRHEVSVVVLGDPAGASTSDG